MDWNMKVHLCACIFEGRFKGNFTDFRGLNDVRRVPVDPVVTFKPLNKRMNKCVVSQINQIVFERFFFFSSTK